MRKIGILPNLDKDSDYSFTKEIAQFLLQKGCVPLIEREVAASINLPDYGYLTEELFQRSELLVVLGGDGTMLGAGRIASNYNTPILGINLGTLGFLTDAERSTATDAISNVLKGRYKEEKRLMVEVCSSDGLMEFEKDYGLNDIYISRGVNAKMVDLRLYVNDEFIENFHADGIIISTPTGSTAYNLSAGGPIIKYNAECLAITAICPHMLNARSIVVSANDIVKVELGNKTRGDIIISVDGQAERVLKKGSVVTVRRRKQTATIVKTNERSFYDILRDKLVRNEA